MKLAGVASRIAGMPVLGAAWLLRAVRHVWHIRRYLTPLKLANIALVKLQSALQLEIALGRPYTVMIEPTNVCNTRCQLCPTGEGRTGRQKGVMNLDMFQRFIDDSKKWIYTLSLYMWGDPLIAKDIYRMIAYAHGAGIWTSISSNLHGFNPELGDDRTMVESGLDELICSLHAASPATFEIYQPGKSFDATIAKIRQLVAARDALGSRTPKIILGYVVTRFNEHEMSAFEGLARELKGRSGFSAPALNLRFIRGDMPAASYRQQIAERIEKWLPLNPRFVNNLYSAIQKGELDPGDADQFNGRKLTKCVSPWRMTIINWDGTVGPCCGSWSAADSLGDISIEEFGGIWNGPRYRAARRSFRRRTDQDVPCAKCPGFLL